MGVEKFMMTESEKDLGVVILSTLKPAALIANCVNKANQMLGMIQRTITYKTIEYYCLCIRVWLDHIKLIEGVQRRFTRMMPELKSLPYEARLKRLNLTTLEIRRIRGDLIEVYTILNGLGKINPDSLFTRSWYTNIRCHTMKLEKKHVHLVIRKYFFAQRMMDD